MNGWIIALIVVVIIIVLLVCLFRHIKKKIRNTIIDKGTELVTKTAENVLDETATNKVTEVMNVSAEILKKKGTEGFVSAAAKKGVKLAINRIQNSMPAADVKEKDENGVDNTKR